MTCKCLCLGYWQKDICWMDSSECTELLCYRIHRNCAEKKNSELKILFENIFKLRPSSSTNGIFRLSVRPSVRLSVTPFWLCSHHRIIMNFSGVITNDQSKVHAKGQGQRSKVKVTEVTTQLNCFRTVTPVWIHIWWWNDAYSLMLLRRGANLTQIGRFRTVPPAWIHRWLQNDA